MIADEMYAQCMTLCVCVCTCVRACVCVERGWMCKHQAESTPDTIRHTDSLDHVHFLGNRYHTHTPLCMTSPQYIVHRNMFTYNNLQTAEHNTFVGSS